MTKQIKGKKEKKSGFVKFKNRLSFLIILLFTGAVFFLGWIQIRIPEGQYAYIHTKFPKGYDDHLIVSGQFVWRWENLIPRNLTMHFFDLDTQRQKVELRGFLPSGELYGQYINQDDAFVYQMEAEYAFKIKEDSFLSILEDDRYDISSIDDFYADYRNEADSIIRDFIFKNNSKFPQDVNALEAELIILLEDALPECSLSFLRIQTVNYPDMELYTQSRNLFLEELVEIRTVEKASEQESEKLEGEIQWKMNLLKMYGEVLSEYPVLLDYYGLEKDKLDHSLFTDIKDLPQEP